MDAQRALSLVRSHAKDWEVDPARVGILGFSAGGHLAAWASTNYEKRAYEPVDDADKLGCKPDFAVPIYPGGVLKRGPTRSSPRSRSPRRRPPTFLAVASDDRGSLESTVLYYLALKRAGVPAELHVYESGGHGFGLRPTGKTGAPGRPVRGLDARPGPAQDPPPGPRPGSLHRPFSARYALIFLALAGSPGPRRAGGRLGGPRRPWVWPTRIAFGLKAAAYAFAGPSIHPRAARRPPTAHGLGHSSSTGRRRSGSARARRLRRHRPPALPPRPGQAGPEAERDRRKREIQANMFARPPPDARDPTSGWSGSGPRRSRSWPASSRSRRRPCVSNRPARDLVTWRTRPSLGQSKVDSSPVAGASRRPLDGDRRP